MLKRWSKSAVLALSLGASSCWFKKHPAAGVFVPPPVQAAPIPADPDPSSLPPAPKIETNPSIKKPPAVSEEMPRPETNIPPRPQPVRRPTPAPKPAASSPANQAQPDSPPRRLGQIFTPQQVNEYTRLLQESLDRVRRALGTIEGKRLNREQADVVTQIRTFQKQAEQARNEDLVTAVNLARRADILAKDLLERLP